MRTKAAGDGRDALDPGGLFAFRAPVRRRAGRKALQRWGEINRLIIIEILFQIISHIDLDHELIYLSRFVAKNAQESATDDDINSYSFVSLMSGFRMTMARVSTPTIVLPMLQARWQTFAHGLTG